MRSEFFAKLCFYSRGQVLSNAHIRVSMRPLEVELLRLKELSDRLAETATVLPPTSSWLTPHIELAGAIVVLVEWDTRGGNARIEEIAG